MSKIELRAPDPVLKVRDYGGPERFTVSEYTSLMRAIQANDLKQRQHSTLGFVSPQQYEDQLRQMARAA